MQKIAIMKHQYKKCKPKRVINKQWWLWKPLRGRRNWEMRVERSARIPHVQHQAVCEHLPPASNVQPTTTSASKCGIWNDITTCTKPATDSL